MSVELSIYSLNKEVKLLDKDIRNLENELNCAILSPQTIIMLIPFLEKQRTALISLTETLKNKCGIYSFNNESKLSKPAGELNSKLYEIWEVWERCFRTCQNTMLNETEQRVFNNSIKDDSEQMLNKLLLQLELLSLNSQKSIISLTPLISDAQKERIEDIKAQVNEALSQAKASNAQKMEIEQFINVEEGKKPELDQEEIPCGLGAFECLPFEDLLDILSSLSLEDFLTLAQTSKGFKELCNNPRIWKEAFSSQTGVNSKEIFTQKMKTDRQKILIDKIEKGMYITRTLTGHQDEIRCVCKEGNVLYSASLDGTIKVWDLKSGECTKTFQSESCITSLYKGVNFLYSGNQGGEIRIWDFKQGVVTNLKRYDDGVIKCLHEEGDLLCSGSSDGVIRIWDLKTRKSKSILEGHKDSINCLLIEGKFLYSGSSDGMIKIWDLETEKCIATLQVPQAHPYDLKNIRGMFKEGNLLFSGSLDSTITIWDLETMQCITTLRGHNSDVTCLFKEGNLLYSGSLDRTIKIWDLETVQCIATVQTENRYYIDWICKEGNIFCSMGGENTIRVLDLNASYSDLLEAAEAIIHNQDFSRFNSFGNACKEAVYNKLKTVDPSLSISDNKQFFLDPNSTTFEQKAQAIYLFILEHIASLFKKGSKRQALALFNKLPSNIKNHLFLKKVSTMNMLTIFAILNLTKEP